MARRSSFLETEAGSLLYTGDFKLRPGRSAEATEWQQADTLIMETTYGLPRYRLPPTELVVQQIVAFCREALEEGATPVLLGYSLGKAQEILCSLAEANLQPMLHGSVYRMTRIYEQFGQAFCQYERYDAKAVAGKVLICPPSANRSRMLEKIPEKRVAMISGWAVEPNAIYRYQVDAAFPLSDHADYDDLLRYVDLVQPKRVLTLHAAAANRSSSSVWSERRTSTTSDASVGCFPQELTKTENARSATGAGWHCKIVRTGLAQLFEGKAGCASDDLLVRVRRR